MKIKRFNNYAYPMQIVLVCILLCAHLKTVNADSRRIQLFGYDAVGNLVQSNTQVSINAPNVLTVSPSQINVLSKINVKVTGIDLYGANVTTSYPNLTVSNVSFTPTELNFELEANEFTLLGVASLIFTNQLGEDTASIEIVGEAPPSPP